MNSLETAVVFLLAMMIGCAEAPEKTITCPLDGAVILPMQCVNRYKAALIEAKGTQAPKPVAPTSATHKQNSGYDNGWRFDSNLEETKISLECQCNCPATPAPTTMPPPYQPSATQIAPASASPVPTNSAPQPELPSRVLRRSTRGGTPSIYNIDGLQEDEPPRFDTGT